MLNISIYLSHVNILWLVYFPADDREWIGYGELNVFCICVKYSYVVDI